MKPGRPLSYQFGNLTVRQDPVNPGIWRVFRNSEEVYSTAGTNGDSAQDRAINYALTLTTQEA